MNNTIQTAASLIQAGGVVAFPTETVYGLGASAYDAKAVARIFEIKQRPSFDPLIVHISMMAQVGELVTDIPECVGDLSARFWPGPLTLVLNKGPKVPDIVTAGLPTIAVRMPRHPMALDLIAKAGVPVAAPSANLFGKVSPTEAGHVREQLGDAPDMVLDGGACEVGVESTIIDLTCSHPKVLRLGGLSIEELEQVFGSLETAGEAEKSPAAPGMLKKHYAPGTRMYLVDGWIPRDASACGLLCLSPNDGEGFEGLVCSLSDHGDLREAASHLFATMRKMDQMGLDAIVVKLVPEKGLGRAINDRLRRACATFIES